MAYAYQVLGVRDLTSLWGRLRQAKNKLIVLFAEIFACFCRNKWELCDKVVLHDCEVCGCWKRKPCRAPLCRFSTGLFEAVDTLWQQPEVKMSQLRGFCFHANTMCWRLGFCLQAQKGCVSNFRVSCNLTLGKDWRFAISGLHCLSRDPIERVSFCFALLLLLLTYLLGGSTALFQQF